MPRLSLAKLERHLYTAADRLRQEGIDVAIYKDYIFGLLFLKPCSDVYDADFVLIGRQGALCGNVARASGRFFATEHAVVCTPIFPVSAGWLYCQLDRMNLNRFSESSAQPGLSVQKIGRLPMPLPPLEEQTQTESVLDSIDCKIAAEQIELTKLRHLKSGLMTDLLEGRVQVPEDLPGEPSRHPAAKGVDSQPR